MATAAKSFARVAARSTPLISNIKNAAPRATRFVVPRQTFRSSRRGYASEAGVKSSLSSLYWGIGAAALASAGGYFFYYNGSITSLREGSAGETRGLFTPTREDYQKVYNEIARRLDERDDYDDGSFGPVLVRLAWHCSGTYDKETNTGGSNGATMRFAPEKDHGANAGLHAAQDFMEPVHGMLDILLLGNKRS